MFASRKRARDEVEDDTQDWLPAYKKCSLPFRTSPTIKHRRGFSQSQRSKPTPLFTQTITPVDSSEEESSPPFASFGEPRQQQLAQHSISSTFHPIEQSFDIDMDMEDSNPIGSSRCLGYKSAPPSPKASPCSVTPPQPTFKDPFKELQSPIYSGRLPTPIYGHFQQSIDGKMDMGEDPENIVTRTQQEIEYEKYVRRRRLPTPIDEDQVMDSTPLMGRLAMDTEHFNGHPSTKTSHSFAGPSRATRLSFSMGIRADCELCRMKLPGHSNHIFKA